MSKDKRSKSSSATAMAGRGNVIDLSLHRWRRSRPQTPTHTIFHIHEDGDWQDLLNSFPSLRVESIQSEESLRARLVASAPELILIDAQLRWTDQVRLVAFLHDLVQVPIVMICGAPASPKTSRLLKQAYAVGLHDAVFAPLQRDDLFESLEVLLKFRRQLSIPT